MIFHQPPLVLLFSLALTVSFPHTTARNTDQWTPLPPIPLYPRQEHFTLSLPSTDHRSNSNSHSIFILGGILPLPPGSTNLTTFPTTTLAQTYSTLTQTWRTISPVPVALNHINAAAVDGKLYVLGGMKAVLFENGTTSWVAAGDSFVYTPKTSKWDRLPGIPPTAGSPRTGRRPTKGEAGEGEGESRAVGAAAVGVDEWAGVVWLAGGMTLLQPYPAGLQTTVDWVSAFSTRERRWLWLDEAVQRMPARRDHGLGRVVDRTFYVLGGRDNGQANVRGEVFALSLEGNGRGAYGKGKQGGEWVTKSSRMPTARGGLAGGVVGRKIYTFGGEGNPDPGTDGVFNETEAYDTVTDSWQRLQPMRVPRHGGSAAEAGGKIYVPGGGNVIGGSPVSYFDVFEP